MDLVCLFALKLLSLATAAAAAASARATAAHGVGSAAPLGVDGAGAVATNFEVGFGRQRRLSFVPFTAHVSYGPSWGAGSTPRWRSEEI